MRVLLIGATGTIGGAVTQALTKNHEVIPVGHVQGERRVDISNPYSITALFEEIGGFDALVSAAGQAPFGTAQDLGDEKYAFALRHKLMGQINLVRLGLRYISQGGVFVLTSGAFATRPVAGSAAIAVANAGIDAFARAASLDLTPRRVCSVSPDFVVETMEKLGLDSRGGISAADTAKAYLAAVEGGMTGVLDVRDYL